MRVAKKVGSWLRRCISDTGPHRRTHPRGPERLAFSVEECRERNPRLRDGRNHLAPRAFFIEEKKVGPYVTLILVRIVNTISYLKDKFQKTLSLFKNGNRFLVVEILNHQVKVTLIKADFDKRTFTFLKSKSANLTPEHGYPEILD